MDLFPRPGISLSLNQAIRSRSQSEEEKSELPCIGSPPSKHVRASPQKNSTSNWRPRPAVQDKYMVAQDLSNKYHRFKMRLSAKLFCKSWKDR